MRKKILILVGPTASGKTEIAYEISKILPVEMISCDSMQIYKSMPITTQAPPKRVTKKLKTHLVSFLEPSREYNAAKFCEDALKLISEIFKRKKTPMIVGGTGLYLRALLDGLFEADGKEAMKDETLRKKLLLEEEHSGSGYLHKKLEEVDPRTAKKIHPNDLRRIVRALEVFRLTGKPISELKPNRQGIRNKFNCCVYFLCPDRAELYHRIDRRVDQMLKKGLVNEVRRLSRKKLSQTAQMALGIREIKRHLSGEINLSDAKELLKKNTRNYAKRQLSWFRHEKNIETVSITLKDSAKEIAYKIVQSWDQR